MYRVVEDKCFWIMGDQTVYSECDMPKENMKDGYYDDELNEIPEPLPLEA